MKKIFLIIFCFLVPLMMKMGSSSTVQRSSKWIFHFDINKTITAIDSVKRCSYNEMLNNILAEKYLWDDTLQFIDFINDNNNVKDDLKLLQDKLLNQDKLVLFSFYQFLSYLENSNIDYAVILRSFGNDIDDVAEEINETLGKTFFKSSASFISGKLYTEEGLMSSPQEIYSYFSKCDNLIVQDDYNWWASHEKHSQYGKPFYYNGTDRDIIHVFFDDNISKSEEINIIAPLDSMTGSTLCLKELLAIGIVNPVVPFQAIVDDEYYVNKFLQILEQKSKTTLTNGNNELPNKIIRNSKTN